MMLIYLSYEILCSMWRQSYSNPEALTADSILELTIYRGYDLDVLLRFLDRNGYPGILRAVVENILESDIRTLLPEKVRLDPEFPVIIADPHSYFGTDDEDELRKLIAERYIEDVNMHSPDSEKRAMIAHVEYSLGDLVTALNSSGFALNESGCENFGQELCSKSGKGAQALFDSSRVIVQRSIETAREMKRSV